MAARGSRARARRERRERERERANDARRERFFCAPAREATAADRSRRSPAAAPPSCRTSAIRSARGRQRTRGACSAPAARLRACQGLSAAARAGTSPARRAATASERAVGGRGRAPGWAGRGFAQPRATTPELIRHVDPSPPPAAAGCRTRAVRTVSPDSTMVTGTGLAHLGAQQQPRIPSPGLAFSPPRCSRAAAREGGATVVAAAPPKCLQIQDLQHDQQSGQVQ